MAASNASEAHLPLTLHIDADACPVKDEAVRIFGP
jgi:hypothetical protein